MSALKIGIGVAAIVAGPPLYSLVQQGSLDASGALQRGGIVTVGCAVGCAMIARLIDGYREEADRAQRLAAILAAEKAAKIVLEGQVENRRAV